jgi:hypothetical protein
VSGPKSDSLSASLEDYLEAIFNLAGDSDVARSERSQKMNRTRILLIALSALKSKNYEL